MVEDEPVVRSLIIEVLEDLGYRTLEAADGPEGLKILQSRRRIDLLITDVGLPGLNGRQLADAARRTPPRPQGAVHHGLRRERDARRRLPGTRHGDDHEAVCRRCARAEKSARSSGKKENDPESHLAVERRGNYSCSSPLTFFAAERHWAASGAVSLLGNHE